MKRLTLLLAGLLAGLLWLAPAPVTSAPLGPQRAALLVAPTDPDVAAHRRAVLAAGASYSDAQKKRVQIFVRSLKASTVWFSTDRLWLFAAGNSTQALIDIKARATATAVNSPTFTQWQGYAGNGTSSYINTGFAASTMGVTYTLNSAHMALYNRTARTDKAGAHRNAGAYGPSGVNAQINLFSFNHLFDCVIHGALIQADAGFADAAGMFAINRSASNASQGYRNGASIDTDATASDGVPTSAMYVGATNLSQIGASDPQSFVTDQHAMFSVGGSLDTNRQAAFYNAMQAYMTSLGTAVP